MPGRTLTLKVQAEVKGLDQLDKIGTKVARFGKDMTTHVTLPLLAAAGAAFKFASDLDEATSKAAIVFGDAVDKIDREAGNLNDILSESTFRDVTGTFGSLLKNMGFTVDAAADLSVAWLKLAQDMSSFHNVKPEQAINAIQSALAGEFEPLKRFGVIINAALIETRALEQGLWDGTGAIDAHTRALIINQELLKQQPDVLGDVARHTDDAANAFKNLQANFTDAAASLGNELLPLGTELLKTLNGWVTGFKDLSPETKGLIVRAGLLLVALGPVLNVFGNLLRATKLLWGGFNLLRDAWRNIPTALGFVDLAMAKTGAAMAVLQGQAFALIGVLGAMWVGFEAGKAIDRELFPNGIFSSFSNLQQVLRDSGKDMNDYGAALADSGLSSREFTKQLLDLIATGLTFDAAVDEINDSTRKLTDAQWDAVEDAGNAWAAHQKVISDAIYGSPDGMVPTITSGAEAMALELGAAPGQMADALLENQFELDDAITEMVNFMDEAISPLQERWNARAFLASDAYAQGLASGTPSVVLKAQEMGAAAQAVLDAVDMFPSGWKTGLSYAAGLEAAVLTVKQAAVSIGSATGGQIGIRSEPKDHSSPLYGITKWGGNLVKTYADGILSNLGFAQRAGLALSGALALGPGAGTIGALTPAMAGGSGGTTIYNIDLHWSGEPPQGRTEAEIAGNLKRLSAVWG